MNDIAHTLKPWRVEKITLQTSGMPFATITSDECDIAYISIGRSWENADHIVTAVNAYDRHRALIETLEAAVKFYADAWCFTTNPKRPGLEWKPKEALLDDCGNVARDALAAAKEINQ